MTYHSVNDTKKEKPTGSDYTTTMDGKPGPLKGSDRFDTVSVRRISKNQLEILESKDGAPVRKGLCDEGLPRALTADRTNTRNSSPRNRLGN
jgi:hypothetical protein